MEKLINQLFKENDVSATKSLWKDNDSHNLILREIAKALLQSEDIIPELPLHQLLLIAPLSPFASSEKECEQVAEIIHWGISRTDIMPMITIHKGSALAYRCFISLVFFKGAITRRCQRYGAPSPEFYRDVGIQSFKNIGQEDIGNHFCQWEFFIGEIFL